MAAEPQIEFEGKTYVLSKEAAEETGYAQDYVGQLARKKEILARRVGGLWYVNIDSLREHKQESQNGGKEEDSDAPRTPKKTAEGTLVMLDGNEYVSTKEAARMCGYSQDYVGQLIRGGKVEGRRVGASWYVLKSAIETHREEKNSKLASVQASSVGVSKEVHKKSDSVKDEGGPLLKYIQAEGTSLPSIKKESRDSELSISESRNLGTNKRDTNNLGKLDIPEKKEEPVSDFDEEHYISVRAMHTDIARKKTLDTAQTGPVRPKVAGKMVYRSVWDMPNVQQSQEKRPSRKHTLRTVVTVLSVVVILGSMGAGAYLFLQQEGSFADVQEHFQSVLSSFMPSVEYKRK